MRSIVLLLLFSLGACRDAPSVTEVVPRTLPAAGIFPELTVAEFRADTVPPGSYNIQCVLRQIDTQPPCPRCPPATECAPCPYVTEGVWVTQDPTGHPGVVGAFVRTGAPRQFSLGSRYRLSTHVYIDSTPPNRFRRTVLSGYDVLP